MLPLAACRPPIVSRSMRSISSSRSLASDGSRYPRLRRTDGHHQRGEHQAGREPQLRPQGPRQAAVPVGLRGAARLRVARRRGCGPSRWSAATWRRPGARARGQCSDRGAAATCRTSSHVASRTSEWPHRRAGRAPVRGIVRHARVRRQRPALSTTADHSSSSACAEASSGPFGPQMGDRLGRVGQHHHPAPVGLHHPHAVGGVHVPVAGRLDDAPHDQSLDRPRRRAGPA